MRKPPTPPPHIYPGFENVGFRIQDDQDDAYDDAPDRQDEAQDGQYEAQTGSHVSQDGQNNLEHGPDGAQDGNVYKYACTYIYIEARLTKSSSSKKSGKQVL